jgi:hypothetical protein
MKLVSDRFFCFYRAFCCMFMKDQQIHQSYSKFYSFSCLLLYVLASFMPSSGSLHVPTELPVPSDSLFIKFYYMSKMTLIMHL